MNFKSVLFLLYLCFLFSSLVSGQSVTLKPSEEITDWYNFKEWIFANTNTGYSSLDLVHFEPYQIGFSGDKKQQYRFFIDDVELQTKWLNNPLFSIPNYAVSDLDSVVIFEDQYLSGTTNIYIYPRSENNNISLFIGRINQINDPGPLIQTSEASPNVEYVNKPLSVFINQKFGSINANLLYTYQDYSRTGLLGYSKSFTYRSGINIFRRTSYKTPSVDFTLPRNRLHNIHSTITHTNKKSDISFLFGLNITPENYEWYNLTGVEVPFKLFQYQVSGTYQRKDNSFHNNTKIGFSSASSDTLLYQGLDALYRLEENKLTHESGFSFKLFNKPGYLTIKNTFYEISDEVSKNSSAFLDNKVSIQQSFGGNVYLYATLGNINNSIGASKKISGPHLIRLGVESHVLNKGTFHNTLMARNIGFIVDDPDTYTLSNQSSQVEQFSFTEYSLNIKKENYKASARIIYKHFWNYVNEDVNYFYLENRTRLGSRIYYFDTSSVGALGFFTQLSLKLNSKIKSKTMLSGNLGLYGNNSFKSFYERVPAYIFSEIVQYKAHENFVLELFFRYIPARGIVEYENLEEQTGFPPSRVRPIPLLNFSTSMWFFNRRLETKLTLRNLLNKAEAFDTHGQYYFMSINASGRINFQY